MLLFLLLYINVLPAHALAFGGIESSTDKILNQFMMHDCISFLFLKGICILLIFQRAGDIIKTTADNSDRMCRTSSNWNAINGNNKWKNDYEDSAEYKPSLLQPLPNVCVMGFGNNSNFN